MSWDWDRNPIYESERIRMDGSRSPLVVYSFKLPRQISDDEISMMLDFADLHLDRGLPYIALIELQRGSGIIGAHQRRMFADWLEKRRDDLRRDDFSTVVVVPEAIFRAVLRVVYRFRNPPIRTITVADVEDAAGAVREELARIGHAVTPETEQFLSKLAS